MHYDFPQWVSHVLNKKKSKNVFLFLSFFPSSNLVCDLGPVCKLYGKGINTFFLKKLSLTALKQLHNPIEVANKHLAAATPEPKQLTLPNNL